MRILGVDSSTYTGLALLDAHGDNRLTELHVESTGWSRVQLIAQNFDRIVIGWSPEIAFIEDYALGIGKSVDGMILQVEIGTVLRSVLYQHDVPWRLIRPKTLKKWVTGNGNANKLDMMGTASERWGFSHTSHNVCDAYCLAQMGRWLIERPDNEYPKGISFGNGNIPQNVML